MKSLLKKIIPSFIFNWYHFLLIWLGAILYNFPSRKLIIIGVTGTNGKSTVVHLITEVLEKSLRQVSTPSSTRGVQGKPGVASISSIRFRIKDKEWKNMLKMTMPGRFKLQKFLKQAVKAGCKYMVLEVTSEGIKQYRHKFIDFNGIVFTNLTKEHIEAHKGFENYKKAKGKLFKALAKSKKKNKFVVLNKDDRYSDYFAKLAGNAKKVFYGKNTKVETLLLGEFNKYNASAAFETAKSLRLTIRKTLRILKSIKEIPGRMELVVKKPFKVYVDYAHTPDSLEKVYKTLGKGLICVLGSCGGGRDKWKRPEIGKISSKYCKKVILTNEDPYDENPNSILKDIESGFSQIPNPKSEILKILDRREAISKALKLAKRDDIVIITGKGCEPWICVEKGKKIPWDERKVVREEFKKIYGKV
jgi:UDP-N-acetylmuramoyl-L-alanyl-D-glutamate--2,6-diaminopimelate ligase